MKSKIILSLVILFCLKLQAQKEQGQTNITAWIGWHSNAFIKNAYEELFKPTNLSTKNVIAYGAHSDFAMSEKLSLGFSYSMYSVRSTFDGYTDKTGTVINSSAYEDLRVMNFGLRLLYHTGESESSDFYFGAKGGYNRNDFSSSAYHGVKVDEYQKALNTKINYGAVVGIRYFPGNMWGFGAEAALGQTYNIQIGICLRGYAN